MKKLVIVTHPDLALSKINKTWLETLSQYPDEFVIHNLYDQYPNLKYDILIEQHLLANYQEIIFQFPIHWYSTPFALKKYIDEVLTYGWAFGPGGDQLKGKKIGLAVSTGGKQSSYESDAGISISSLLNDFKLSFEYCGCEVSNIHIFYGAMDEPTDEVIWKNAQEYIHIFRGNHIKTDKELVSIHSK